MELTTLGFDSAELGLLSPLGPLLRKVVECSAATDPVANSSGWPSPSNQQERAKKATKGGSGGLKATKGAKGRERRER